MKADLLKDLKEEIQNTINDFYQVSTPMVFGSGNLERGIILIGEAPGKNEIQQGKPFVGQAGKNLDEFINILDIQRTDLYITNVVKLRPYKVNEETGRESNRTPTKKEVALFTSFLMKELEILQPKLVVTLGNIALKCVTQNDAASIGTMHGEPVSIQFRAADFELFPLYHPASIIYKAELKEVYLQDLFKLKKYLQVKNI